MVIELETLTTLKSQYDEDEKAAKEDKEDLDGFSVDGDEDEEKEDEDEDLKEEEDYLE